MVGDREAVVEEVVGLVIVVERMVISHVTVLMLTVRERVLLREGKCVFSRLRFLFMFN